MGENMTEYQKWEKECDNFMLAKYGVGIDDIPDMCWHDWFTSGMGPEEAVIDAIHIVNEGEWL
jgi:hypothetical protein